MHYVSTRGGIEPVGFQDAVMMGLAPDGGLLLPAHVPDVTDRLDAWRGLSYADLAVEIMLEYADLDRAALRRLVSRSCEKFSHPDITPVRAVGDLHILELFHGPTLAFKDVALQFLGNLFEFVLSRRGDRMNILAATSGDTGSAAIHGVRGRERIRIFVMHPRGRISEVQRLQMTSVLDENVFNLAVEGTFDDCQRVMKAVFGDLEFKRRYGLGAVNSINWARLLAQMVYYFYAAFRVQDMTGARSVQFAVPTGNFGDIFAGFLAGRMGLPVSRLVLATNENDILARFFKSGEYRPGPVHATLSPSMDIQVASNFERYLYYRLGERATALRGMMEDFSAAGRLAVAPLPGGAIDELIVAGTADRDATLQTIAVYRERHGCLLDPHTAVGVAVGSALRDRSAPMICLATAHPAKFPEAVREATGRDDLVRHPAVDRLRSMPTRCATIGAGVDEVKDFIRDHGKG